MKKLTLVLVLVAIFFESSAQKGVAFFTGTWEQTLAKAQKEKKPIYVDFYTTWCGPCKRMDAEFFPNTEVGQLMNENLIPVHIDAERGEGISFAAKYNITSYPTSIYMNPYGEPFERVSGYGGVGQAKEVLTKALEKYKTISGKTTEELLKEFEDGKRDLDLIKILVARYKQTGSDYQPFIDAYVKTLSLGLLKEVNIAKFLSENPIPAESFLAEKMWEVIDMQATALPVNIFAAMTKGTEMTVKRAIATKDEQLLKMALKQIDKGNKFQEEHLKKQGVEAKFIEDAINAGNQSKFDHSFQFYAKTNRQADLEQLMEDEYQKNKQPIKDLVAKDLANYAEFQKNSATIAEDQKKSDFFINQEKRIKTFFTEKYAEKVHSLAYLALISSQNPEFLKKAIIWVKDAQAGFQSDNYFFTEALLYEKLKQNKKSLAAVKKALGLNPESNEYNEFALKLTQK